MFKSIYTFLSLEKFLEETFLYRKKLSKYLDKLVFLTPRIQEGFYLLIPWILNMQTREGIINEGVKSMDLIQCSSVSTVNAMK